MNDIIKELTSGQTSQWIGMLTDKFGFSSDQAKSFVPSLLGKVTDLIGGGKLDFSAGLDPSALLEKLDVNELAGKAGVDVAKAKAGLEGLLPSVTETISKGAGGLQGLTSMLGEGDAKGLLGGAGKLFGR